MQLIFAVMSKEEDIIKEDAAEELYERKSFKVDARQEPLRIDKWVQQRIVNASRNKVQQAIEAGFLTVNGNPVKSNYKIRPGDDILLMSLTSPETIEVKPEPIALNIVYEDEVV